MVYPRNYKTVMVLDHGSRFLQATDEPFEFDVSSKSKSSSHSAAVIPQAALYKSHWTCSIEAGLEFSRIVYDIFSKNKLISFIGSEGAGAHILTGWSDQDQDLDVIQRQFGNLGLPSRKGSRGANSGEASHIEPGLAAAIDQLLSPTARQQQIRYSSSNQANQLENNGRVVCVTMAKNDGSVDDIISSFLQMLEEKNGIATASDDQIPISDCELVLVIVLPVAERPKDRVTATSRDSYQVSPELTVSVVVTDSGRALSNKMVSLAVSFFNLVITSVTGIPMKEEQNASSSANYDVELLHSFEAHRELISDLADGCKAPSQEIEGVDSVTLKWCTPKASTAGDMQLCLETFPISPVDANSRPSLCLTNFLLNGRYVMLEQPRKSGSKVLSHMLSSHAGQIYIHSLSSSATRNVLDDPPSISEGVGGRITDYRIQAFGELVKEHTLVPVQAQSSSQVELPSPSTLAEQRLERITRFWPMTIGETMIFNLQDHIEPLLELISTRDTLTDDDVNHCRQVIFDLMRLEEGNLLGAYSSQKSKRKEEYSRQLWTELDKLISAHANTSERHAYVLNILTNCKPAHISRSSTSVIGQPPAKKSKSSEQSPSSTDLNRESNDNSRDSVDAGKSRDNQQQHSRKNKPSLAPITFKDECLLSIWTKKLNSVNDSRHAQFSGSLNSTGNKAVLYSKLNSALMDDVDDSTPLVKNCPDH